MTSAAVANYARAMADVAFERDQADEAGRDLNQFGALLSGNRELSEALENPAIPFSAKRAIVEAIGEKAGISKIVVNLVLVLLENARIEHFDKVVAVYDKECDARRGILRARVYSRSALDEGLRERLERDLSSRLGAQVRCEYHIDEAVIAGLRVRVGSTVYDSTVQARLGAIRRRLSSH